MTTATNRNKAFHRTHEILVGAAIEMISENGVEALSLASLASKAKVSRTTIYYHFPNREALLSDVQKQAAERIAKAFDQQVEQGERIEHVTRFIVENPVLMKLWIDDFISTDDIHSAYPMWDSLVASMKDRPDIDGEVYAIILLAGGLIGPRILANTVARDEDPDQIVARFRRQIQNLVDVTLR